MRSWAAALAVLLVFGSIIAGTVYTYQSNEEGTASSGIREFSSYVELRTFLDTRTNDDGALLAMERTGLTAAAQDSTSVHSVTNVQVQGVDEEDLVKTDGRFVYSAGYDAVHIVKVGPDSSLTNASTIDLRSMLDVDNGTYIQVIGLHLSGEELMVICEMNGYGGSGPSIRSGAMESMMAYSWAQSTSISFFNISDREAPVLGATIGLSGHFSASRMIGDDLFLLTSQSAWEGYQGVPAIPSSFREGTNVALQPQQIFFDPEVSDASQFMNLAKIDMATLDNKAISFLSGYSSVMYMSTNSMYLTFSHYDRSSIGMDDKFGTVSTSAWSVTTKICKVDISADRPSIVASGVVAGIVLNPYAMDEKGGLLRIATLVSENGTQTCISILSPELDLIGAVDGIGRNETIQSSRYVNDTLYLVTFRQVDPLFVIDLSVPGSPKVLGELTIPGFSTYLHPVNATHLVGIGLEDGKVKVSLFNVSDPSDPLEEAKMVLSGISYSTALYDPHAVLFDERRMWLTIPLSTYDEGTYAHRASVCIFNVSGGSISLVGTLVKIGTWQVDRALYIDDALLLSTGNSLSAYSMPDLEPLSEVLFDNPDTYPFGAYSGIEDISIMPAVR